MQQVAQHARANVRMIGEQPISGKRESGVVPGHDDVLRQSRTTVSARRLRLGGAGREPAMRRAAPG
jgi:hypothetical protein